MIWSREASTWKLKKNTFHILKKICIPELCPSSEAFLGLHNYHRIDVNKVKSESKVSPRRQVTAEPYGFPMTSYQLWRSTPKRLIMPGFIGNKVKSISEKLWWCWGCHPRPGLVSTPRTENKTRLHPQNLDCKNNPLQVLPTAELPSRGR